MHIFDFFLPFSHQGQLPRHPRWFPKRRSFQLECTLEGKNLLGRSKLCPFRDKTAEKGGDDENDVVVSFESRKIHVKKL